MPQDHDNTFALSDLQISADDLHQLLEAACDVLREMPHERDGERDTDLDRVSSLVRIAAERAEAISRAVDRVPTVERRRQEVAA